MALPDQSRLQFLTTRILDTASTLGSFLTYLTERFDRIPVFPVYVFNDDDVTTTTNNTTSFSFITDAGVHTWFKEESWTDVVVDVRFGCWISAGVLTHAEYGVQIDGTNYTVGAVFFGATGQREAASNVLRVTGLPAGRYTTRLIFRRAGAGAGTIQVDNSEFLSTVITEVIPPRT